MNSSVMATETLKLRSRRGSLLALMNSSTSGWSTRKIPMLAPRRTPPCRIASVAVLNTSMNETGPDATPMVERTTSPDGRSRENAKPVPPPVCWIIAAHFTASKISGIASPTGSTKHADSCPTACRRSSASASSAETRAAPSRRRISLPTRRRRRCGAPRPPRPPARRDEAAHPASRRRARPRRATDSVAPRPSAHCPSTEWTYAMQPEAASSQPKTEHPHSQASHQKYFFVRARNFSGEPTISLSHGGRCIDAERILDRIGAGDR